MQAAVPFCVYEILMFTDCTTSAVSDGRFVRQPGDLSKSDTISVECYSDNVVFFDSTAYCEHEKGI